MADEMILRAEPRVVHGKKVKALRREGFVPGVVYGPVVEDTISVSVNRRDFDKFYMANGHSTVFTLEWDGGKQPVLIREVQVDPVTRNSLHVDFFAPNMRVVLSQTVPVVISHVGTHEGVLQTVLSEVMVEALPADLPQQIDADATSLVNVGDSIHAKDLPLPSGVTLITDGEELIASLVAEAVQEEDETAAEGGTEDAQVEETEGQAEQAAQD
jgi:large subunit ribosomal protein L25